VSFCDSRRIAIRYVGCPAKRAVYINPLEHEHQKLIEVMNGLLARFLTVSAEDELQSEGQKIVGQIVTMSVEIIRREWLRVQRGV
jgi:hypothetical protein